VDFISHILIGKIISSYKEKKSQFWAMFFSFLPDLSLIPFYLILGFENNRVLFFPYNQDWAGTSISHYFLSSLYFLQHSFLFAFIFVLPIILYFRLPKIAFFAYFFHILIDIPTHTGEWAIKIFYPFNYAINGFTDAWSWPFFMMFVLWVILSSAIVSLGFVKKKIECN